MKLGVMGGTFDPIHTGHIKIAYEAYKTFSLDKVLFIPTGHSFFKEGVSEASIRYCMTKEAVSEYDWAEVSDCEIVREGNTYTKDTIKYLKEYYDNPEIYFIIGEDTLPMLEKWYEFEYVLANLNFVVSRRVDKDNGASVKAEYKSDFHGLSDIEDIAKYYIDTYNANINILPIKPVEVSSSAVRKAYRNGDKDAIDALLIPDCVKEYIENKGLYKC